MLPAAKAKLEAAKTAINSQACHALCLEVIEQGLQVDRLLEDWMENFQLQRHGPLYLPRFSVSAKEDEKNEPWITLYYQFSTLSVCYQVINYWSGMMATHEMLVVALCLKSATSRHDLGAETASGKHETKMLSALRNICQCIEYLRKEENGKVGLLVASSTLRACYTCLQDHPSRWRAEQSWIENAINQVDRSVRNWGY